MSDAAGLIQVAAAEIGYREQSGNRSKYGAWYGLDGQPWCMMFISWCADQAGLGHDIIPKLAYCPYAVEWFALRGQFHTAGATQPYPGDLVFFDSNQNGVADHVGLAESVSEDTLTCIEGNRGDAVSRVVYRLDAADILGYGRPAYAAAPQAKGAQSYDPAQAADTAQAQPPAAAPEETVRIRLAESGRIVEVGGFLRAGSNYIRLRDVERLFPVTVGYDEAERLPTLRLNYRT